MGPQFPIFPCRPSPAPETTGRELTKSGRYSATINSVPQETPGEITLADLAALVGQVLNQQGYQDDVLHQVQAQLDSYEPYLKAISGEVDRLGKLADQAEKFLHNPIGAYKAARGKLIPRGPAA